MTWTVHNLLRSDGYFSLKKGRFIYNRLPSLHWGQATMLDALGAVADVSERVSK